MIKAIAMIAMMLDHIGQVFYPNIDLFTVIGRLAFPLYAWEIAMGFKRTKNVKLYAARLFTLAILSQYPHCLLFNNDYINVCFTLLAGLLVLCFLEAKISIFIKIPFILFICTIANVLNFEYGVYGIALIVSFYIIHNKYFLIVVQIVITAIGVALYNYYHIQFLSLGAIILILVLRRYDFKINKIVNYCFYPVHIIILFFIRNAL